MALDPATNTVKTVGPRVLETSVTGATLIFAGAAITLFASAPALNMGPSDYLLVSIGSVSAIVMGLGMLAFCFVLRIPRFELTQEGLTRVTMFRTARWDWSELGPFSLHLNQDNPVACAFTQDKHTALEHTGEAMDATPETADVLLELRFVKPGRNAAGMHGFVEDLNEWRAMYRDGQITTGPGLTRAEADRLRSTIKFKNSLTYKAGFYALCILVLVALSFVFADIDALRSMMPGQ